ncbi:PhzF family phenazine biosynthesis protein [Nocardia sp. NEAU-G5]|uniref:PhzF family phenazine biosynthesis protein n=1 Tax=Nocardia albiluteola TaxID=2842303 RepID=A0ABS6AQ50_9NOCA|nr:PhzF family phenazine biosynthesis protein [Nocardia albiluteola]MBU3060140.1 PhzF family phenazine biosynthesis protein [Nocardia albiluteola]
MVDYEVVRVFCGPDGRFGNQLGVVRDGATVADDERLEFARRLGFSETVFVDDVDAGEIDIWTPSVRMTFAGHPCVGTAWLLGVDELGTRAGRVTARRDGEFSWITAQSEWAPPRTLRRFGSAAEVDALEVPPPGEWIYAWAWEDEVAGTVRARAFPGRGDGIDEDEATGAAAIILTADLGRPLTITQGRGSQIVAKPLSGGRIEIGGRVRRSR